MFTQETSTIESYLQADEFADWTHQTIAHKASVLFAGCSREDEAIKAAFNFVCTEIAHSADINSRHISHCASEVLLSGEGICYAKTMLLAALLRSYGVPTGYCYQSLRLDGTPDTPLVIHALNAVWLSSRQSWLRIDARGNTSGIAAKFAPPEEHLAFPVRPEYAEFSYPVIYAAPHQTTIQTLHRYTDCREMFENLPAEL